MIRPHQLAVLIEGRTGTASPHVPYAGPSGVLYAVPNVDGTRKNCGNCYAWAERDQRCVIHKADQEIVADEVCGYHVFGTSQLFYVQEPAGALDPRLSGLELVIGGASCDTCRYYDGGSCVAVADPMTNRPPTRVDALGCCARWVRLDGV